MAEYDRLSHQLTQSAKSIGLLLRLSGLLIWLCLSSIEALALDKLDAAKEIDRAQALLARGDCNAAWNVAWPLAKSGNQLARYFLYQSINGRTIPPGVTRDSDSFYRHVLVLAAYAALTPLSQASGDNALDHRFARIDVPASIAALRLGADGERVAECYRNSTSFQGCFDLGVSLAIIPKFSDYAKETEQRAIETGIAAYCIQRH